MDFAFLSRVVLGFVFLFAAFSKLRNSKWHQFAMEQRVSGKVVLLVPPYEALLGTWLISNQLSIIAVGLALVTLLIFTASLVFQLLTGEMKECNCFGALSVMNTLKGAIIRNTLLIVIGLVGLLAI